MQDNNHKKEIPDKFYFKVGEVSTLAEVPAYVLRFWETEFEKVKPKRTPSGQRLYSKSDVELILEIRHLLYEKKFTIQGAKKHLKSKATHSNKEKSSVTTINDIRMELEHIRNILDR